MAFSLYHAFEMSEHRPSPLFPQSKNGAAPSGDSPQAGETGDRSGSRVPLETREEVNPVIDDLWQEIDKFLGDLNRDNMKSNEDLYAEINKILDEMSMSNEGSGKAGN